MKFVFILVFVFNIVILNCSRISQPMSSHIVGFEINSYTMTNVDDFDKLYDYELRIDTLITDVNWNKHLVRQLSKSKLDSKDTSFLKEFRIGCIITYSDLSKDTLLLNVDKDVLLNGVPIKNSTTISEIFIGLNPAEL